MLKRDFIRWLRGHEWTRAKPLIPESEMPTSMFWRVLAHQKNASRSLITRGRVYRIGVIRNKINGASSYAQPYQHRIARIEIILEDITTSSLPSGNLGAIFEILPYIYFSLKRHYAIEAARYFSQCPQNASTLSSLTDRTQAHPALAEYLLFFLLEKSDREIIPGDLEEDFTTSILPKFGLRRARFWYWSQTLKTIWLRNPICRWVVTSGGAVAVGSWVLRILGVTN